MKFLSFFNHFSSLLFIKKTPHFNYKWQNIIKVVIFVLLLWFAFCLPNPIFVKSYSTTVYDCNNQLLGARVSADGSWHFSPTKKLSDKYIAAVVAFEDKHFFHHLGVNPVSLVRAFKNNLSKGKVVSGGSTLTMQTIRLSRNKPRTYIEKIIEIILATRLELQYSKKSILAMYASHAPFGGNIVGIDAASWRFFGHPSSDLSWAEAALLAVLPNAPSAMYVGKNREALLAKRNRLLSKLYISGEIDKIGYQLSIEEPIPQSMFALPNWTPHIVSSINQTNQGKRIKTSINLNIQPKVETIVAHWHKEFEQNKVNNLAAIVWDVQKGEIIAYCGNVSENQNNISNQVDIVQSPRSSGSILKPFLYQVMLHDGDILPNTLIADIPMTQDGFNPQNYTMKYDGAVPASLALSRSLNLPAVNMLKQYGVPKFLENLRNYGFSTLKYQADHYGLTLILGGGEVCLHDVSLAYLRMAQSLIFINHTQTRTKKLDWGQAPIFSKTDIETFPPGAVWQTFQALINVNRPEEIDWKSIPSMQKVAWKTGTSYGFRDAWAVGVTPQYVVGVWVGNASGEGRPGLTGTSTAAPVMFDIFNTLGRTTWFDKPENAFRKAEICRKSGHLAGRFCDEIDTVDILPQGLKTEVCPYHTQIYLSENEKYRVYNNCYPTEKMIAKKWFVLPPSQEWYYKQSHTDYRTIPPLSPECQQLQGSNKMMEFIYPNSNSTLLLSKQLDGTVGAIVFEIAHRQSDAKIYWHLDNNYLGETQYFNSMSVVPPEGDHTITAVDNLGNSISKKIKVKVHR